MACECSDSPKNNQRSKGKTMGCEQELARSRQLQNCAVDLIPSHSCIPSIIPLGKARPRSTTLFTGFFPPTARTIIGQDTTTAEETVATITLAGNQNEQDAWYPGFYLYWSTNLLTNVPQYIYVTARFFGRNNLSAADAANPYVYQWVFQPGTVRGAVVLMPTIQGLDGQVHNPINVRGNISDGVTTIAIGRNLVLEITCGPNFTVNAETLGFDSAYLTGLISGLARTARVSPLDITGDPVEIAHPHTPRSQTPRQATRRSSNSNQGVTSNRRQLAKALLRVG